jgi:protocatechuate 3,4-dioxygenase beta subunit
MPSSVDWKGRIVPPGQPGEPLVIEGIIFKKDGKTPAAGVVLYVYHTNEKGVYAAAPGQTGMVARHGKLRGWVKTGKDGRYQFTTIRPATYPNTTFAAHIHPMIKEEGLQAYYIDEYVFEDDPFVKADYDKAQELRGGSGVIKLKKDAAGVWIGKRDIILGMNIPGY